MNDEEEIYESLIRLSLLLVFMCALVVGTIGLVSICQMLMREQLNRPEFVITQRDFASTSEQRIYRSSRKKENFGWASVASADGLLYFHFINGDVALVDATPEAYREKGRFTPPAQPQHKQAGPFPEGAFAYPVIANGRLYIRDLGTLWAYDIKTGS